MGKIIGFHGCDAKSGTTMISQCVAEQLAKGALQQKVLLLHLSNQEGINYMPNDRGCIDELHSSLKSNIFTTSQLISICYQQNNLYSLTGLKDFFIPEDVKYMPEMAIQLLTTVRNDFDFIVVDVGNNIFWGLTMGALLISDQNYMLITQRESYLKRYEKLFVLPSQRITADSKILKPPYQRIGNRGKKLEFEKVVINQYKNAGLRDVNYIIKRLNISAPIIIPYHDQEERAEIDGKSLLYYKNKAFEKAIKQFTEYITNDERLLGKKAGDDI